MNTNLLQSSLLSAFIGEMLKKSGDMVVNGSVAYAPQIAWIQNCSLRDNITFGQELDFDRYWDCIRRSGLLPDLDILPDGDMTEIGEKGINLSGGQRQRVSLARCIYNQPDILLLDDPLSAVDAYVGKQIFENCIMGNASTRVLVTHQLQYLKYADKVYVMNEGKIAESGTFEKLIESEGLLKKMIGEHMIVSEVEDIKHEQLAIVKREEKVASALMQEEERVSGSTITAPIVKSMISFMGGYVVIIILGLIYIATQATGILTDFVLSQWSEGRYISILGITGYLSIYAGIGTIASVLYFLRDLITLICGLRMAYRIHGLALERIFVAPMTFFDTTPLGRILSRFSKDQENVDNNLIIVVAQFFTGNSVTKCYY